MSTKQKKSTKAKLNDLCRELIERKLIEFQAEKTRLKGEKKDGTFQSVANDAAMNILGIRIDTLDGILVEADMIESMLAPPDKGEGK